MILKGALWLPFIPGKVAYSALQKSHLLKCFKTILALVPHWVWEEGEFGGCTLVPPSWGDVTTFIIPLRWTEETEKERSFLGSNTSHCTSACFIHETHLNSTKATLSLALRLVYCVWFIHQVVHLLQEPANNALLCSPFLFLSFLTDGGPTAIKHVVNTPIIGTLSEAEKCSRLMCDSNSRPVDTAKNHYLQEVTCTERCYVMLVSYLCFYFSVFPCLQRQIF